MNWLGRKEVSHGQRRPIGYGIACHDFQWDHYACYPVPLNWCVWAWRGVWMRLVQTPNSISSSK